MKHNNKTPPPPTGKAHRLTPKQEKFCIKYSECGNASEAYRYAYQADNMKPETVNNKAFGLLQKGEIGARVEELRRVNQQLSEVKRADILARLKSYFNFDIRKILTVKDGMVTVKDSDLWDAETAQAVEAVEVGKDGQAKVTIVGKTYAINRLCAMCGFDAPSKHTLNLEEMTDAEVNALAQAIVNNDDV